MDVLLAHGRLLYGGLAWAAYLTAALTALLGFFFFADMLSGKTAGDYLGFFVPFAPWSALHAPSLFHPGSHSFRAHWMTVAACLGAIVFFGYVLATFLPGSGNEGLYLGGLKLPVEVPFLLPMAAEALLLGVTLVRLYRLRLPARPSP